MHVGSRVNGTMSGRRLGTSNVETVTVSKHGSSWTHSAISTKRTGGCTGNAGEERSRSEGWAALQRIVPRASSLSCSPSLISATSNSPHAARPNHDSIRQGPLRIPERLITSIIWSPTVVLRAPWHRDRPSPGFRSQSPSPNASPATSNGGTRGNRTLSARSYVVSLRRDS